MEDKQIFKDHYVYSFRVDFLDNNNDQMQQNMKKFVDKYEIPHYVCFQEEAKVTKKIHYQGALWFPYRVTTKGMMTMRNWWARPKGGISITKAKKLKSLLAYIKKDFNPQYNPNNWLLFTNIDMDIINNQFGTWELDQKKVWLEKLEDKCKELAGTCYSKEHYVDSIIDFYTANAKAPPTRNTLYKFLLRYHPEFSAANYRKDLGMFKEYHNYY